MQPQPLAQPQVEAAKLHAQALLGLYARRDAAMQVEALGDPAWFILLHLFIRRVRDEQVPVVEACGFARLTAGTAMRYLKLLEAEGQIVRERDPAEPDYVFVRLSDATFGQMASLLTPQ